MLAAEEPERFDPRWDAFLAAYIEHFCGRGGLEAPGWTGEQGRYLEKMWWSADYFDFERGRVVVTTPPAFESHGVWIADTPTGDEFHLPCLPPQHAPQRNASIN